MNPKQISQDDLILFALQDLSPAEAAEVLVHLEHSETARAELAQIQADLAMYALTSEQQAPPAQARERFMRQISKTIEMVPKDRAVAQPVAAVAADSEPTLVSREGRVFQIDDEIVPQRSGMGFFGWAGWAVAAGFAVTAGLQYRQHESLQQAYSVQTSRLETANKEAERAQKVMQVLTDGGAMQVSLRQTAAGAEPPKPTAHAAYAADSGSLVFVAMHMAQLDATKTYELWVIPADGHAPIPAGLFKPNEQGFASVIMPDLPKGVVAKMFGVTIENEGGSEKPTAPIVMAGM